MKCLRNLDLFTQLLCFSVQCERFPWFPERWSKRSKVVSMCPAGCVQGNRQSHIFLITHFFSFIILQSLPHVFDHISRSLFDPSEQIGHNRSDVPERSRVLFRAQGANKSLGRFSCPLSSCPSGWRLKGTGRGLEHGLRLVGEVPVRVCDWLAEGPVLAGFKVARWLDGAWLICGAFGFCVAVLRSQMRHSLPLQSFLYRA